MQINLFLFLNDNAKRGNWDSSEQNFPVGARLRSSWSECRALCRVSFAMSYERGDGTAKGMGHGGGQFLRRARTHHRWPCLANIFVRTHYTSCHQNTEMPLSMTIQYPQHTGPVPNVVTSRRASRRTFTERFTNSPSKTLADLCCLH